MRRSLLQLKVLSALRNGPITTIAGIAEQIDVQRPSVSRSMKLLRESGLVRRAKGGWTLTKAGRKESTMLNDRLIRDLEEGTRAASRALAQLEETNLQSAMKDVQRSFDLTSNIRQIAESTLSTPAALNMAKAVEARLAVEDALRPTIASAAVRALTSLYESQVANQLLVEKSLMSGVIGASIRSQFIENNSAIAAVLDNVNQIYRGFDFQPQLLNTRLFTGAAEALDGVTGAYARLVQDFVQRAEADHRTLNATTVWREVTLPTGTVDAFTESMLIEASPSSEGGAPSSLEIESSDELDSHLHRLDPRLANMRRGAWEALNGHNPDKIRQAAVSMRELLRMVLEKLAPGAPPDSDPRVAAIKWRIRQVIPKSDSAREFVRSFESAAYALNGYLNKPTHEHERRESAVRGALIACDGVLMMIFAYAGDPNA